MSRVVIAQFLAFPQIRSMVLSEGVDGLIVVARDCIILRVRVRATIGLGLAHG